MMKLFLDMLTLSQDKHLFTTCPPCHHTDLPTQLCVSSDWLTLLIFPWLLLMTPHWHWHPPAGPGGDLSSVWQESNRYRVTAGGQHWTWALSCRERPGKWELWADPAQTQNNGSKQTTRPGNVTQFYNSFFWLLTWHSRLGPPYPRPPPIRRVVPRPRRRPKRCEGEASPSCPSRGWN